jgi:anti-anti-sigma regulatory factor
MMLRITVISSAPSRTLKVEGRIAGDAVKELWRVCEESLADNGHTALVLDLADVSFLDQDGIELIRHLGHRNVVLTNYSPFLAELLKEVVPCS